MQTSPETKNIAAAIIAVMKKVKGIDKTMTVGKGESSYKGVSDQEVKKEIGKAMEENGLCLVPTDVTPTLQIDRWEETNNYGTKQKQSVFTEVKTKYLLLHESGEWIELSGYGHGTDTQDKAAGKATTYALKYTLLYTFMVPTGKIDDADNTHSDDMETPTATAKTSAPAQRKADTGNDKQWLNKGTKEYQGAVKKLAEGSTTIAKIEAVFKLSKEMKAELEKVAGAIAN